MGAISEDVGVMVEGVGGMWERVEAMYDGLRGCGSKVGDVRGVWERYGRCITSWSFMRGVEAMWENVEAVCGVFGSCVDAMWGGVGAM